MGIIIMDPPPLEDGEGRSKEQQYSADKDYSVGRPRENGYRRRRDDNRWSDEQKADAGLTFKEPM